MSAPATTRFAPPLAGRLAAVDATTWALAAATALGAALRFGTLGLQSLWKDEAVTVVRILHPTLGGTLAPIPSSEATPPLYYILAWAWTRPFGTSEVGIRSLSALVGTATIPLVYVAATRLASRRAGVIAAAIAACNPYLIWYSQEARAYALLAFLATLSFVLFLAARERPAARTLAAWAVVSALALATHYFAVFTVAPEAIWLLLALRRRALIPVAAVAAAGAALVPLALHQEGRGHDGWIAALPLARRITDSARYFLVAPSNAPSPLLSLAAGTVVLAILWLLVLERARARVAAAIAAATLGLPLVLSLAGYDFFFHRNLIAAVPLLAVVAGIACAPRRAGLAFVAILCALGVSAAIRVDLSPRAQRADWRAAARAIGPASGPRAIVTPSLGDEPLEYYLGGLRLLRGSARVQEVAVLGWPQPGSATPPPPPGLRLVERRRVGAFTLVRYRGSAPVPATRAALAAARLGRDRPGVLASLR